MPSEPETDEAMKIARLRMRFRGRPRCIVDITSAELPERGVWLVMEPSGLGKTTLFRAITGWYDQTEAGSIAHFAQFDAALEFDPFGRTFLIGGHQGLLPWNDVRRNIDFFCGSESPIARELLDDLGLAGATLDQMPHELSLGMYKRIELAIAIARAPEMLILDEIVTSVDKESRGRIIETVQRRRGAKLTIISTHTVPEWNADRHSRLRIATHNDIIVGLGRE